MLVGQARLCKFAWQDESIFWLDAGTPSRFRFGASRHTGASLPSYRDPSMSHAAPAIFTWSTDAVPAAHRFAYFEAAVSSALTPMSVSGNDVADFDARFAVGQIGAITVHEMHGAASVARRGSREIARSGERTYYLLVSLGAPWTIDHRAPLRLAVGDCVLVDSCYPYVLEYATRYDVINVKLTETWLRQWLPHPDVLVGRRIARDSRWGTALTSYVAQLSPQLAVQSPLPASVIADQVGALLALMAHELMEPPAPERVEIDLAGRITRLIEHRCCESMLTAVDVAAVLGISVRTLHRALSAGGRTFGREVQNARAERALQMLRSSVARRLSLAEIGRRTGFCDASHFARVLRSHCGMTPSQIRRHTGTPELPNDAQV
jgi:AraC family transcriptional regulator, positive regulator of tynA and feaB